jgi:hypothetical protein
MTATTAEVGHARVFPCLGWHALAVDEVVPYVTWCALSGIDRAGSGRIRLDDARAFIVDWRGIDPNSARRLLRSGEEAGYWRVAAEHVHLAASWRLIERAGLDHERAPHIVALDLIAKPAAMKAHLFATVYEIPGHSQRFRNGPLTREIKEQLTGVPETTQRRYDSYASELVQETSARVIRRVDSNLRLQGDGYYTARDGSQWRRLADYRVPRGHVRASRSAAAHALRKVRALREQEGQGSGCSPVTISRGFSPEPDSPPQRRFYSGKTEAAARRNAGDAAARPSRQPILGWGEPGKMEFLMLEADL